jgi:mannose-1-phosphate guanylyltransferase/phosphomannomutase
MRAARIEDGVVVGDECLIEEESVLSNGVRVYPFKTVEAGAVVHSDVIWEQRSSRSLFGPRGISGVMNVEITPELAVRLAGAYATTLKKGDTVTCARDGSRAARALKRAVIASLTSSAINVRDLESVPTPVARLQTAHGAAGGVVIRTTPGVPDSVDIAFLDSTGADLSPGAQRKLDRTYSRGEYRRAFPGEIGDLGTPSRIFESYVQELLARVDTSGIPEAQMKIVVDVGGGAAGHVLPPLLGRLGVDAYTVNLGIDEAHPTESPGERHTALRRLGALVASSEAAFGVRFDPVGERIWLVDDTGARIDEDRALLVILDLVAAEKRGGNIALPVTTTRVAERVAGFHGVGITWVSTAPDQLTKACSEKLTIFGGDARGGFVVPEFHSALDGIATFTRLLGLVSRTHLTLSQIDTRIPHAHVRRMDVPTPWAAKGMVMRTVLEAAEDREIDTTDGVRIVEPDGRWTLVLPDPAEAVTHLWAEAPEPEAADRLLGEWAEVVERPAG